MKLHEWESDLDHEVATSLSRLEWPRWWVNFQNNWVLLWRSLRNFFRGTLYYCLNRGTLVRKTAPGQMPELEHEFISPSTRMDRFQGRLY